MRLHLYLSPAPGIAAQLEARGARPDLQWAPRTWNPEAEALSNLELGGSDPEVRVVIEVAGGP